MRRAEPLLLRFRSRSAVNTNLGRPVTDALQAVSRWEAIQSAVVVIGQSLRVTQNEPLFLAGFQRKHTHLKRRPIDPFQ